MNNRTEPRIAGFFMQAYATPGQTPETRKESHPTPIPDFSVRPKDRGSLFRIPSELFLLTKERLNKHIRKARFSRFQNPSRRFLAIYLPSHIFCILCIDSQWIGLV